MKLKKNKNNFKFYFLLIVINTLRFFIKILKKIVSSLYKKLDWKYFYKGKSKPDRKAEKWASHNKWFGDDEIMTNTAFKIHRELVEFEGVDPKSRKYYNELDKRLYDRFKERFSRYFSMDN